ncbi:glycosyltransferase [Streptomyces sp. DK15]|uniref:glycosyltransferase n=1 Tax=Streptomyces sp. DK15 TaxID=2957499 RepID=UPI0029B6C799|nr:glycosyltransferase [Streptomyces sp. DK15]MDX2389555.1 glycosyltransferase [Streptomyces sp. DK15]
MRVAVMTAGSHGDVAPFTGLGHGLAQAGHDVTLVTHARFASMAVTAGIGFHALPVDPHAELHSAQGQALHDSATGAGKLLKPVSLARKALAEMADELLEAAESNDVLLLSGSLGPIGHTIAEGLGLAGMGVYLQLLSTTGEFPPPVVGTRSCRAMGNRFAGRAVGTALERVFADTARDLRSRIGLPPTSSRAARHGRERQNWPIHHGFSPLVVPRPRDWRTGLSIGGYWWPLGLGEGLAEVHRVRVAQQAGEVFERESFPKRGPDDLHEGAVQGPTRGRDRLDVRFPHGAPLPGGDERAGLVCSLLGAGGPDGGDLAAGAEGGGVAVGDVQGRGVLPVSRPR